jgi:hypothetical protein
MFFTDRGTITQTPFRQFSLWMTSAEPVRDMLEIAACELYRDAAHRIVNVERRRWCQGGRPFLGRSLLAKPAWRLAQYRPRADQFRMGPGRYGRRREPITEYFGDDKLKQQDAWAISPIPTSSPRHAEQPEVLGEVAQVFISEDSNTDVNNFLWAYNLDTKKLSRVLSAPARAEMTGLHAVDENNGWTYVKNSLQHPGTGIAVA